MELSIIIPVYNSELILPKLVQEINKVFINKNIKKELIFINDYSNDNSWKVIKKLSKSFNYIKGIDLMNNYGQHNAIAAGLNHALGEYIIMMDDDLQHDPIYILDILAELKRDFDACYVKYLKRKHVMWKRFLSYINHVSSSYLSNKSIKIYTSSFKGINKRISYIINRDQNYEVFLDWLIVENSKKIQTIDILHRKRLEGKTNYDFKKLIILWSNMIIKIKPKNKFKILLLSIIKLFIKLIVYKILKKKEYKEKFLVSEKTF
jgi:polyisoprenyl-phosphate glycosyltransferase